MDRWKSGEYLNYAMIMALRMERKAALQARTRTCLNCSRQFTLRAEIQKYCSEPCRKAHKPAGFWICPKCNKRRGSNQRDTNQRYWCKKCRREYSRQWRRKKKKETNSMDYDKNFNERIRKRPGLRSLKGKFREWWQQFHGQCGLCKCRLGVHDYQLHRKIPSSVGGEYTLENVIPVHPECNRLARDLDWEEAERVCMKRFGPPPWVEIVTLIADEDGQPLLVAHYVNGRADPESVRYIGPPG